ncbi:GlsB/YeaQ/YmgE family stress response membrane protein [Oerskovia flava]|uniref:GlsB/YeaQ/YmgE family stress response membrane protein n=1 Tax=Oerskovia flava TaxID=2986422 RepID=UPI0022405E63|nr:GlsB/YeaQ/YmgE family stress response membrane protein [Oerskovia sp. JB1-3-2]
MGFLSWILIGLIMGAIARAVMPGRAGGGWIVTLLVGILGALVGGFLGGLFGFEPNEGFFSWSTWIWAFIGSLVVLLIWGAVSGRKKT